MAKVTVIGGGIAGLVAGAYAARSGAEVRVLESVSELGGRARTRVEDGFCFNMGPHALYRAAAAGPILKELGIVPDGAAPPLSGALARREGRLHALPGGFVSLLTTGLFGLAEKLEVGRLLAGVRRLDTTALDAVPLGEAVDSMLRHEPVRELLHALCRLTGYHHSPDLLSAGAALHQFQLSFGGVLYLHGGWASLVEALADRARAAGATLESGVRVRGVHREGSGYALDLDGDTAVHTDAVVLAVPLREMARLVDGGQDGELATLAESAIPVRAASLDLALTSLPRPKQGFALGIDEPTYVSVHSNSARLAPAGGALIHATRYLAPEEQPDRAAVRAQLEGLVDDLQPGWREHVHSAHFLPNLTVTNWLPTAATGGLAGRPGVQVPGWPGLYRAGDGVGTEGLLADASFASGRAAGLEAAGARRLGVAA
ncbi:MAG: FAD-dependent oxidoreductase [Proteobacteria bacterium]|nr:FAD-dependent oxidoreductase [Pseudomonadota bacterium]